MMCVVSGPMAEREKGKKMEAPKTPLGMISVDRESMPWYQKAPKGSRTTIPTLKDR